MITSAIEGKLVRLRIATEEDAEFTLSIRRDKKNTEYLPKLDISVEEQKKWLIKQAESDDCYFFLAERLNGEKIGTFSLYNIHGCKAETGRLILRGNQIEDIEACILFHNFVFDQAGINYVSSDIYVQNMPAVGLAYRLGSKEVGRKLDEKNEGEMVIIQLSRQDYCKEREKLQKLVDRFAGR